MLPKLLLVEDSLELAHNWATTLALALDVDVRTARTTAEMLPLLRSERYDLVISDVYEWNDIHGRAYESVLRAVKTSTSTPTPVIFTSRLATPEDIFRLGKLGAFDFLFIDTGQPLADRTENLLASVKTALAMRLVPRVFISYSSPDRSFAEGLASQLKERGLRVWYDGWEIMAGDSIIQKVQDGLSSSDCLILILSPASVSSRWVQEELNSALMATIGGQDIFVIPILKDDCDLPPLLRSRRYVDFRTNYEAQLNELESSIRARMRRITTHPADPPPKAAAGD